ncbi:MAG: sigma-70 family RNA polymerase sigma factor [Bacteroidaceae bacterium]|nr:sigma-70 family RNA polymerase sigma factor [Bacteroidaceae bacterium]
MKELSFRNDVLPLKDRLFRLAMRITLVREDAEDMVQETLIRLWKSMQEGTQIDNLEAFALTVCRNLCLDYMARREQQNVAFDEELHDRPDATRSPYDDIVRSEQSARLNALINTLPEKQRTAMQLRDIEGRTYREIADIMQISESDVKVNIFRARRTVREHLQRKGT